MLVQGLVINEFNGNEDEIFPIPDDIPVTPEQVYQAFLNAYGFGGSGVTGDVRLDVVLILVLNLAVFRLLTLLCLRYITYERL